MFKALQELGWNEGKNIVVERRYADNWNEALPELAAELVRLNVDVIVANVTLPTRAAKQATSTIPIVMIAPGDPVGDGLVDSLARPGGNVTGMSALLSPELAAKRLQLLKEVLPGLSRVAVLWDPAIPASTRLMRETEDAARTLGIGVESVEVRSPTDFDAAFKVLAQQLPGALITIGDPLTLSPSKADCWFCDHAPIAVHIWLQGVCRCRRPHVLWAGPCRIVAECRWLRG